MSQTRTCQFQQSQWIRAVATQLLRSRRQRHITMCGASRAETSNAKASPSPSGPTSAPTQRARRATTPHDTTGDMKPEQGPSPPTRAKSTSRASHMEKTGGAIPPSRLPDALSNRPEGLPRPANACAGRSPPVGGTALRGHRPPGSKRSQTRPTPESQIRMTPAAQGIRLEP